MAFSAVGSPSSDATGSLTGLRIEAGLSAGPRPLTSVRLRGKDARKQLLVTGTFGSGAERDLTRQVEYELSSPGIVRINRTGLVTPVADGEVSLAARMPEGPAAHLRIAVENYEEITPINFPNQIVPIFTKTGCNSGGCHGKASGQNGFKLSLLGFEPAEDYEHLVKEARGRRLFPAAPDQSLFLLKARGTLPHGGGKRLEADSSDYQLLVRWISQGMPYGRTNDPTVERIEVLPPARTLPFAGEQQLAVTAYYSDGSAQDVTGSALYEPNDKEMARVNDAGLVSMFRQPGDVAVMVRYQGKVAVFRATIPLGAPVGELPVAKNFIDELIFKKLKTVGLPPSGVCDDSAFVRRVTLDLAGRLPSADEARRFVADPNPAKREHWIERLLESAEYADYFANKWSALLRNKRTAPTHTRGTYAFHAWIRDSLLENKPYDQFVREILAASGDLDLHPPVAWYRQVKDSTAQLEDTAQLFLGTRLQCAQCHHHPFEKWSQQDYFSFAAFFAQVGRKPGAQPGEEIVYHKRGKAAATNKKTKQNVTPAGLGGPPLDLEPEMDPRHALVDWMAGKDNPFFARALVNRYWKHFFNRGLVDPEDDLRETNPPTNPELLEALAQFFIERRFDLKALIRAVCQSHTYQLSAVPNAHNQIDKQNFSRYYPRRLTAEVLLDSINLLTLSANRFDGLPAGTRAVQLPDNSFNAQSYFLTVFGRPDMSSSCECERSQDASLAQSLHLLNSKEVQDKLTADAGQAAVLASDSKRSDQEKIRELYWLAFSREPNAEELELALKHLGKKPPGPGADDKTVARRAAYEDILWALVNTKEFLFNH